LSHSLHCVQQDGRLALKVVEPNLHDKMATNANGQVLRPPAVQQVALAAAAAAGIQPEQPEGQVVVQQVVNAPNDEEAPLTFQLLGYRVSCVFAVFQFPLLARFRFFFGRRQICSPMPSGDQLFVLFAPVWQPVCCCFFPMPVWCSIVCFIFACGAISLYPSGDKFVILCLCGCKLFVFFLPVWR